jgi:hypothetical protein
LSVTAFATALALDVDDVLAGLVRLLLTLVTMLVS